MKRRKFKAAAVILCAAIAVGAIPLAPSAELASGAGIIMGDVNMDGVVDTFDLVTLRQLAVSTDVSYTDAKIAGDVNGSGSIDGDDLVLLSDYLLGKKVTFTCRL